MTGLVAGVSQRIEVRLTNAAGVSAWREIGTVAAG